MLAIYRNYKNETLKLPVISENSDFFLQIEGLKVPLTETVIDTELGTRLLAADFLRTRGIAETKEFPQIEALIERLKTWGTVFRFVDFQIDELQLSKHEIAKN